MAKHNVTGKEGEKKAADYLLKNGYAILYQNWRHRHWEIDLIATKNQVLHFVEVKTRTSSGFGFPEEKIDRKKIRVMMDASAEFLFAHPGWKRIQLDILSITMKNNDEPEFFLIEDVYL